MSDSPSSVPDYSAFPAAAPAAGSLAQLSSLVERAHAAELAVADAEAVLEAAQITHRRIVEIDLPEAMSAVGMDTFRTSSGLAVSVRDELQVKQPPVAQRAAAYSWLEDNGQGGLIKRGVEIAFGAGLDEAERAHALADRLGVDFPGAVREQQEVNSTSLKAYLARALKAGESPPLELFGARRFRVAKINQK
jgi:hypothetical protein